MTMAQFRKKPVVIEAVQFKNGGLTEPTDWLKEGLAKARHLAGAVWVEDGLLFIHTLEGLHRADDGDWIIRGVKGELYPCKPDIFAATYEAAE